MLRKLTHRIVPSHFRDPLGLAGRVWRSGGREGRFALFLAGLGLLAAPLDLLMRPVERRLYRRAVPPRMPMLFVCGPARSGTTVVAQALARALPVGYFSNLTSVFPRSPITASRVFRVRPRSEAVNDRSHYGRTAGFSGPNDALYLWDRWMGGDRTLISQALDRKAADQMVRFFGAYENWVGRPIVTKNNALNAHATIVGSHLPTARFICMDRDPLFLAQSLLVARKYIQGDTSVSYGLADSTPAGDPVTDVCRQVRFHQEVAREQRSQLGGGRFHMLSYDDFCTDPTATVRMAAGWLGVPVDEASLPGPFEPSRSRRVSPEVFARLEEELGT